MIMSLYRERCFRATAIRLLNSAMMPAYGRYEYHALTAFQFGALVSEMRAKVHSYVGYPQTAQMIEKLSGVLIPVCRDLTPVNDGDVILVAKLRYRVTDPKTKGDVVPSDFEFGIAFFEEIRE